MGFLALKVGDFELCDREISSFARQRFPGLHSRDFQLCKKKISSYARERFPALQALDFKQILWWIFRCYKPAFLDAERAVEPEIWVLTQRSNMDIV